MVTWDDFDRIWARTSPLTPYEFSEPNYSQGWNFVGSTPPARQMWDSIQKKNDEKFKYLRDNFGTPNIVTSSSQMTDTDKVYVYMGSEAGWNNGHWYYYNEGTSSWEDGGVYNSVAFVTDTTLSIAGQPADAKATGDALALKSDLAGCTFTGNVSVNTDFSVTGDSSFDDVSISGTAIGVTPTAGDNTTKLATTEYVQNEVKPIETDVDIAEKDIANIKALLQGHLYDYQTDNSSAYTKSVPSGAMPYAGLEKVGGKTVVWNQLVDSGTTTVSTISGRKYYTLIDGTASIVTADGTAITIVDDSADMVCDLTLMFGAGNEPSTTDDFTAIFGATHYSYNAGTLLSAGVTEVVSKDGNNSTLQTYSIPASIQALEGYGWSAGSAYNYVDFERKVFVQNVARVDFGSLTWITGGGIFQTTLQPIKPITAATLGNLVCSKLTADTAGRVYARTTDKTIGTVNANGTHLIWVYDSAYSTASDFTTAMNGVMLYYELETPIETDISAYLTDDNLIQVEAGGTLTFPNSNGTDYQIPVPSEEEYMIDLQEALS